MVVYRQTVNLFPRGKHRWFDSILFHFYLGIFDKINSLGATVVVVTHDLELVHQFDHRIVTIENGKIVSDIPSKVRLNVNEDYDEEEIEEDEELDEQDAEVQDEPEEVTEQSEEDEVSEETEQQEEEDNG